MRQNFFFLLLIQTIFLGLRQLSMQIFWRKRSHEISVHVKGVLASHNEILIKTLFFRFNQCFGVLGVLDRIHGTDALFRNTRCYTRHIMMLSFLPPREAIPDPEPCKHKVKGKQ